LNFKIKCTFLPSKPGKLDIPINIGRGARSKPAFVKTSSSAKATEDRSAGKLKIFDFLGRIIKPITDLIDNPTTSDEENLKLKNELVITLQNNITMKVIDY